MSRATPDVYRAKIRYLASVFIDAESIVPNVKDIGALVPALGGDQLLPTTVQELAAAGGVPRMAFLSTGQDKQLILLSQRFDYSYVSQEPEGSDLGTFEDFCRDAMAKLVTVVNHFQRKPHRLAAVQEGYLATMPPEEMDRIAGSLFKFPPTYAQSIPHEWVWRAVAELNRDIDDLSELTNTITTGRRQRSQFLRLEEAMPTQVDYDRIRVDFDINTHASNTAGRFEERHIRSFFNQASRWHDNLSAEVITFMVEE